MSNTIKTKEVNGKLVVFVEAPLGGRFGPTRVAIRTKHLVAMLAEKNIQHGACIKEAYVTGWREETRRGEWIFELPKAKPAPKKTPVAEEPAEKKPAPKRKYTRRKKVEDKE